LNREQHQFTSKNGKNGPDGKNGNKIRFHFEQSNGRGDIAPTSTTSGIPISHCTNGNGTNNKRYFEVQNRIRMPRAKKLVSEPKWQLLFERKPSACIS
jgi:hypothetical protein